MMDTETTATSRRPLRRKLLWGALIASPFLFLLAWRGYEWYLDRELRAAIAEADRLDPGWRLAELEAARAEILDEENAALQVLAARRLLPAARLLPADWLAPPPGGGPSLQDKLNLLPANEELDPALSQRLTGDLGKYSLA